MKSRYWAFIVYPESCKKNWENELEETGLQFAVSPLHDKDIDIYAEGGPEIKKAHWHVLIEYEGPKTYKSVKEDICDKIGATIPKKIESLRGYYRYLIHMDNPEKAQYKLEDIKEYNGFHLDLTTTEVTRIMNEITDKIIDEEIFEYSDLIDYYKEIGDNDFVEIIMNHTYFFDKYISSRRNKNKLTLQKKGCNIVSDKTTRS